MNDNTDLDPKLVALIPKYKDEFKAHATSVDPTDKAAAEQAFKEYYEYVKAPSPIIVWTESPFEAAVIAAKLKEHKRGNELDASEVLKTLPDIDMTTVANKNFSNAQIAVIQKLQTNNADKIDAETILDVRSSAQQGQFSAYWVSYYTFLKNEVLKEEAKPVDIAREIMKNTSVYYTFSKVVVAAVKPVKLHHITKKTDDGFERILLHNTAGMAVEFSDGTGVFAIEGYTGKSLLECAMEMRIDKAGKEQ